MTVAQSYTENPKETLCVALCILSDALWYSHTPTTYLTKDPISFRETDRRYPQIYG